MTQYLTCAEVAETLKVKKTTVWTWIRTAQLNAVKFGRDYRIRSIDLDKFMSERLVIKG